MLDQRRPCSNHIHFAPPLASGDRGCADSWCSSPYASHTAIVFCRVPSTCTKHLQGANPCRTAAAPLNAQCAIIGCYTLHFPLYYSTSARSHGRSLVFPPVLNRSGVVFAERNIVTTTSRTEFVGKPSVWAAGSDARQAQPRSAISWLKQCSCDTSLASDLSHPLALSGWRCLGLHCPRRQPSIPPHPVPRPHPPPGPAGCEASAISAATPTITSIRPRRGAIQGAIRRLSPDRHPRPPSLRHKSRQHHEEEILTSIAAGRHPISRAERTAGCRACKAGAA